MKNHVLAGLLVGLLFALSAATAGLSYAYVRYKQKLHRLQMRAVDLNRDRNAMNSLMAETIEYSKRNPVIEPLLRELGNRSRAGVSKAQVPSPPASIPR